MIGNSKIGKVVINLSDRGFTDVDNISDPSTQRSGPANANGIPYVMPLRIKTSKDSDFWLLPIEPLVSVSGGNVVARRNVAKSTGRGTIKERWTQDDYEVTVEGVFINTGDENTYPDDDVQRLRRICEAKEVIEVECDLLKMFNITRMVIEKFDFPFTKGDNVQKYTFSGPSDDISELLIDENAVQH